jgi:predicted amidohydrolase
MKIALVQMECRWGEIQRNLDQMERHCGEACSAGATMIVFPELTTTGIFKDDRVWEVSENLDGASVHQVSEMASRHKLYIGFGFSERAEPLPYNAYAVVAPDGAVAGVYRKNCIPRLEVPWWQGHDARPVFEVAGRRCGVAICWDTTQPALLAEYGRNGAEIVLMPHAWDADPLGLDGQDLPHESMDELYEHCREGRLGGWRSHDGMLDQFLRYIPARARENRFYALFVNQCGRPHEVLCINGPTFAVDPKGEVLVSTRDGREQMLLVDIP